ncbi:hypothetical protein ABVT39_003432 [Epinephelus coioides]
MELASSSLEEYFYMMSFLIAAALQPDTLCLQLYYDIQIPLSKAINKEIFKMVFSSSNLIEIQEIVVNSRDNLSDKLEDFSCSYLVSGMKRHLDEL